MPRLASRASVKLGWARDEDATDLLYDLVPYAKFAMDVILTNAIVAEALPAESRVRRRCTSSHKVLMWMGTRRLQWAQQDRRARKLADCD